MGQKELLVKQIADCKKKVATAPNETLRSDRSQTLAELEKKLAEVENELERRPGSASNRNDGESTCACRAASPHPSEPNDPKDPDFKKPSSSRD